MENKISTIDISANRLFEMFKLAHFIAIDSEVSINENVQNECIQLATELAGYVEDFERKMLSENKELPYNDSILENPDFEWYLLKD